MKKLRVHSIETMGTKDGPGLRLVVFVQGCNMRCVYCQNPDTQARVGEGRVMEVEEILALLEKGRGYYMDGGGLTVSGGEPTLQADALVELFDQAQRRGFHTALDSNGSVVSGLVERLYGVTDLLLLDVKHIDPGWHRKVTGLDNEGVLFNARLRERMGMSMWLRYVLVPRWTDQAEWVYEWGEQLQGLSQIERVEVLPFHQMGRHKYAALGKEYVLKDVMPASGDDVGKAVEILKGYFGERVVVH